MDRKSNENGDDNTSHADDEQQQQISAPQNSLDVKRENISDEKGEENGAIEEDEILMDELIKFDEEREDTALALLGGSLDSVCTYSEGYKNRQPLYSCKTCFERTGQLAGICYACSENCHDGHNLVEMYSKRRFCCDCGNAKFETKCKLFEEKDANNKRNKYSDNFKGIFCSCKKAYPPDENDATASVEDMFQCCMCEDWFHPSHIFPPEQSTEEAEKKHSLSDDSETLICKDCVDNYPFLGFYVKVPSTNEEEMSTSQNKNAEEQRDDVCKLEAMKKKGEKETGKSVWMEVGWREELCRCQKCMNLYEDFDCSFLLEPEDTLAHFEQQNREKASQKDGAKDIYQIVVEETKEHETALKMMVGFEQMKRHCKEFLRKRADEKSGLITGEDVEQCFAELRAKRMKLEEESQQNEPNTAGDGPWTQ
ncbi:hypothetical protein niasHS_012462 [Heterodera schachtii]|uniref:UBR-type domain-containing protein n=1 Tax=Heterodera schachtii TaxID=97005 RepID=A0ABD2IQH5_HETSC